LYFEEGSLLLISVPLRPSINVISAGLRIFENILKVENVSKQDIVLYF
jgi:hypothetical protein